MPRSRRRPRPPFSAGRQLRRRRLTWWGVLSALFLLLLSALLDRAGAFKYPGDDWATYDKKPCLIVGVADGDTVTIRPMDGGKQAKVRLLGIDAPELRDPSGKPAFWSNQAKAYLAERVRAKAVTVRLDQTDTRDKYDRLLAYLYLDDSANLNLDLVRDGHAYAHRQFDHALRPQFEQAENEARQKDRGLWKSVREAQMPPWRQRWLEEVREKKKRR